MQKAAIKILHSSILWSLMMLVCLFNSVSGVYHHSLALNVLNNKNIYNIYSLSIVMTLLGSNPQRTISPQTLALHDGIAPNPTHFPAPDSALWRVALAADKKTWI